MSANTLKWIAILTFILSLVFMLGGGYIARDQVPPYPGKVVGQDGSVLFKKADIVAGQDIFQRYGLMDHGSVWGHGSQRGMDFSAATLHMVGEVVRDHLARQHYGVSFRMLDEQKQEIVSLLTIALLLFSWRGLVHKAHWKERAVKASFFGLNIGLLLMALVTLFPVGIIQAWTSYQRGFWAARDATFFEGSLVSFLGTIRIIPDLIIIVAGVCPLLIFFSGAIRT